jgi:hypothetical protein
VTIEPARDVSFSDESWVYNLAVQNISDQQNIRQQNMSSQQVRATPTRASTQQSSPAIVEVFDDECDEYGEEISNNDNDCRGASSVTKPSSMKSMSSSQGGEGGGSRPRTFPAPHERTNQAKYTRETGGSGALLYHERRAGFANDEKQEDWGGGGGGEHEEEKEQERNDAAEMPSGSWEQEQHLAAVRRSLTFSGKQSALASSSSGHRASHVSAPLSAGYGRPRVDRSLSQLSHASSYDAGDGMGGGAGGAGILAGGEEQSGVGGTGSTRASPRNGGHGNRSSRYSSDGLVRQEAIEKVRQAKENWEKKMALRKRQEEEEEEEDYIRLSTLDFAAVTATSTGSSRSR